MDNEKYLTEQIITYIGNKRRLLGEIIQEAQNVLAELGKDKAVICDLFSGSGIVARCLKQYSSKIIANDMEHYSRIINECYLTNSQDFNEEYYEECLDRILSSNMIKGPITENYAPKNDNCIKDGERVFYTHENAMLIDTYRLAIEKYVPNAYKKFFLAPLLYEASVHANTSGVFKGFYKSKKSSVGKFGGEAGNALKRILGMITLNKPVFSDYNSESVILQDDANEVAKYLNGIDITYIDPPYNQHPYGSNYFMLNTILDNKIGQNISKVAGIPEDWNKSRYNKKAYALDAFDELVKNMDSKYLIISYNNEGFISYDEMIEMLSKYGDVRVRGIDYVAFRGSRNLKNRNIHTIEYLFTVKKKQEFLRTKNG